MGYGDIEEPIDVISVFTNGRMRPLRFKWKNQVYPIEKVNSKWITNAGANRYYHFSVMAQGPNCFELCFDALNLSWTLNCIYLEG